MIPIVGVSLEEALLGFGGDDDAELHDKEVSLTTSDVTGSQTAIFEYDPQNEPTTGTPAGPWDGYSLFAIDLSGVKDDIENLQQRISDAETCRQQVIAALQRYDPDYDPAEGECPSDKVGEVVDEVGELKDELEQCHDCKDEVIAAIQQYIPDYDPDEGECPAPEIQVVHDIIYQEGYTDGEASVNLGSKFITDNGTYLASSDNLDGYDTVVVDVQSCGYVFPVGTDPIDPDFIDIIGMGKITDTDTDKQVTLYAKVEQYTSGDPEPKGNVAITAEFKGSAYLDEDSQGAVNPMVQIDGIDYLIGSGDVISYSHPAYNGQKETGIQYRIDSWDKTTGTIVLRYRTYYAYYSDGVEYSSWSGWDYTRTATIQQLAGYGDTTHTYRVKNVNN